MCKHKSKNLLRRVYLPIFIITHKNNDNDCDFGVINLMTISEICRLYNSNCFAEATQKNMAK